MSGYNVLIPSFCRDASPEVTLPIMDALQELEHTPVVMDMQSITDMYRQIRYSSHGCYEIFEFYVSDLFKRSKIDFGVSVGLAAILEDTTKSEAHHLAEECKIPNFIYLLGRNGSCIPRLRELGAQSWEHTYLACGTQSLTAALIAEGIQNVFYMQPGTSLRLYYPEHRRPANAAYTMRMDELWLTDDYDVSFVGSYDPLRAEYLEALVAADVKLAIWGDRGWEKASALRKYYRRQAHYLTDVNTIYNSSKINLDLPRVDATYPDYVSPRVYDCLATHSFLATWRRPQVGIVAELDHEVASYGDIRELVQLVQYYLANELDRHAIATRANGRIKDECSWRRRLEQALPRLEMHMLATAST